MELVYITGAVIILGAISIISQAFTQGVSQGCCPCDFECEDCS